MKSDNLPAIIIGEKSPAVAEKVHMLLGRKFALFLLDDIDNIMASVQSGQPDMVLINYDLIGDWNSAGELFEKADTLVYGDKIPLAERIRCYRLGARRVIALPSDSAHQAGIWVRNILGSSSKNGSVHALAITEGRIDQATVPELFFNAFIDHKSVVIKTHYSGWQASAIIFEGQLIDVLSAGNQPSIALGKMLQLTSGTFRTRPIENLSGSVTSRISLWAALVNAQYDRRHLHDIAGDHPDQIYVTLTESGAQSSQLEAVVGGGTSLMECLLQSERSIADTLDLVNTEQQAGKLRLDYQAGSAAGQKQLDLDFVREKLFPPNRQQGGLLIFGPPEIGRSDLIRSIAGAQRGEYKAARMLEFTRIALGENKNLTIIGISIDENILPVLQKVSGGMLASIFLVDGTDNKRTEFTGYLLKQVMQIYQLPVVVGIKNIEQLVDKEKLNVHEVFGFPEEVVCVSLSGEHLSDLKLLLENLPVPAAEASND